MIEIKSREQAIEELGKLGAKYWDSRTLLSGYVFIYPKPLEPLTNEELHDIWLFTNDTLRYRLRAVVEANDERNAEIEKVNPKPLKWRTDTAPENDWVAVRDLDGSPTIVDGGTLTCGAKWYPLPQVTK